MYISSLRTITALPLRWLIENTLSLSCAERRVNTEKIRNSQVAGAESESESFCVNQSIAKLSDTYNHNLVF